MIQIGGTIHSPINVVMKQQRDGAINLWRLVYSAACGIAYQSCIGFHRRERQYFPFFIEIILVIRENCANFAFVLVL